MLIRTVAAECDETVVIIHAPGAVDVEQWIDIVQGVLFAGLPGQEYVLLIPINIEQFIDAS
jgi:beta-glucosidase